MILFDKKENLSKEDKLRIKLMEVLALGRGYSKEMLVDPNQDFDFRQGSNFYRLAQTIMDNFELKEKIPAGYGIIKDEVVIKEVVQEEQKIVDAEADAREVEENEDLLEESNPNYKRKNPKKG